MAVRLGDIKPGSVLRTKCRTYVYLGYYRGTPRPSRGDMLPGEGYLYACLDGMPEDKLSDSMAVCNELMSVAMEYYSDKTGCYTAQPKRFAQKLCDVDLSMARHTVHGMWGLERIGDSRLKKNK